VTAADPFLTGLLRSLDGTLAADDEQRRRRYPGPPAGRQPVHTCYVPAGQFTADTARQWGDQARAALDEHGPLPRCDASVEELVRAKLAREPVEDLRIDFEDGYGPHTDDEEDDAAAAAARALAGAVAAGTAPPFSGLRMKCLEEPVRRRAVRTLDRFLATLAAAGAEPSGSQTTQPSGSQTTQPSGSQTTLPPGFRVTLPKVTSVAQVAAMAGLCAALEAEYALPRLDLELQVETPQAVLGPDGTALVAPMLAAADGRCVGLHFGTYDYTAALGIAAGYQSLAHPAADHAKAVMQAAAAGTGAVVSDGSLNVLPVGTKPAVRAAWQQHAALVRRSLERGFYQGWDLHPAQLPSRYAATFGFYRDGFDAAAARLARYLAGPAGRTGGGVLDEPATARALASFLRRGLACGAVTGADLARYDGLTVSGLDRMAR
jgi:citrate lyase beta subunit